MMDNYAKMSQDFIIESNIAKMFIHYFKHQRGNSQTNILEEINPHLIIIYLCSHFLSKSFSGLLTTRNYYACVQLNKAKCLMKWSAYIFSVNTGNTHGGLVQSYLFCVNFRRAIPDFRLQK